MTPEYQLAGDMNTPIEEPIQTSDDMAAEDFQEVEIPSNLPVL